MNDQTNNSYYHYEVKFELANDDYREKFDFYNIEDDIKKAINDYNALKAVRNKKKLSYEIESNDILVINISSPIALDSPSKALAKFTRILLGYSELLEKTVKNKRVFRSIAVNIPPSGLDKYSTEQTLKRVIEIFCGDNSDEPEMIELQRKIKDIIL